MTDFEQDWHNKYMSNMVALSTLEKLVAAGKLSQKAVDEWVDERQEKYGL